MPKTNRLIRRPAPSLPRGATTIGKEGLVERSFDDARGRILRCCSGERFEIAIRFTEPVGPALVSCYTNMESDDGSWLSIPFEADGGRYVYAMTPEVPGIYGFRVQYSFDNGSTWIWDRASLMSVHVDPNEIRDVRCYTFIPNVSGKVDNWILELDRIRSMGFNMVHLLPVTEMDGSESPYSAKNLFVFDPAYYDAEKHPDGMDAFEAFVEAARKRRIALCIDLVLNHIGPGSNVAVKHPDWIMADRRERDGMKRSGCWHMNEWLKWGDLVKVDYDHPNEEKRLAIWEYMKAYALFWANYAAYTGGMVRLDNLHNSDEAFVEEVVATLRKAYPHLIIHAEFFSDANTLLRRARNWDINLFLANQWEYPYAENLRDYLTYLHDISGQVRFYTPVTTHDTGAPVQLFGSEEALVTRYFITALMGCGKTGMVQGGEFGLPEKVNFIGRNHPFPYTADPSIVAQITRINWVMASFDALHRPKNIRFVDEKHGAIIAAYREIDAKSGLLLMANLDIKETHELAVDLSELTGASHHTLREQLNTADPIDAEAQCEFEIPPSGVAAYLVTAS